MEDQILESILEKYSFKATKIKQITGEMYRLEGVKGAYFARITNYRPYEMQLEEVRWTNYLYHKGLSISPAILSKDGNLVEKIKLKGDKSNEERTTTLYRAADGDHLAREKWDASILRKLGRVIGRLHRCTKDYQKETPINHLTHWYKNEEYNFLKYIPQQETAIRSIASNVLQEIKNLPQDKDSYGLIHGDIWLENTLVAEDGGITIIDFQDCEHHYYLYDLAVPIYSALEFSFTGNSDIKRYKEEITAAIINGYQEEHPVPTDFFNNLSLLLKLKELFEYSLMHMYWDKDSLTEEQVRIFNLYRMRLESDLSFI
ncbi:phosphotransferase enzyme family protein [Alkaliphilus hydrothermalis]|uniref:Ser/Thr protein kinase RdoA (MazF antagonist) n=1 Tax=Alkaliphilus hydrothermalis TaxID=1482730 RepID=A0ABS2NLK3_9FIRM|nr:phosphotransferase [Alkaliphilus hydrothermalis]MBM7613815.1 Ser/Thr protein kinase RdoA (MazF antagonist) [Alkaliphilus hydrothermalis]